VTVKRTEKVELVVQLERRYGFAAPLDLALELPGSPAGITVEKIAVPADQAEGRFTITAAENAPPGQHTAIVRATAQFNNINVEATLPATIEVTE
jgi:hypothetical protein